MPSEEDIDALRDYLDATDEAVLISTLSGAGYHMKGEDKVFRAPNGREINMNADTPFQKYLELTGCSALSLRARVIADVCGNARSMPDQFAAVFRAAAMPRSKPIQTTLTEIANSSERSAKAQEAPWWTKWEFWISTAIAIALAIWGYKCSTTPGPTPPPATAPSQPSVP